MDPDDIVMISDIAERVGVHRMTVYRWSNRADFPDPVARLNSGPVYNFVQVRAWLQGRGR